MSGAHEGLWCEITAWDFVHRLALFLDRDGGLVEDTHYLGMRKTCACSKAPRLPSRDATPGIVLVTNQSVIARRLYDWQGFHAAQPRAEQDDYRTPRDGIRAQAQLLAVGAARTQSGAISPIESGGCIVGVRELLAASITLSNNIDSIVDQEKGSRL